MPIVRILAVAVATDFARAIERACASKGLEHREISRRFEVWTAQHGFVQQEKRGWTSRRLQPPLTPWLSAQMKASAIDQLASADVLAASLVMHASDSNVRRLWLIEELIVLATVGA